MNVPDPRNPYDIKIGSQAFNYLGEIITSLGLGDHRIIIITSESLASLYGSKLAFSADAVVLTIKDGEKHKNWASVQQIHQKLFAQACARKTLIISVGGGTVGDIAAFAASIYMRGLPLIHVPTSLLAMVDSSVGGKCGIDTPEGKNLLGSFYMPRAVLIHSNFLNTLAPEEFACGMAEIIKHALIGDASLFYDLKNKTLEHKELITRAVRVKINLVASDPHESNVRAYLNLGHTFGHAIEKVSDYSIKHGEAVAIGLVQATRLALRLGILEENFLPELIQVLERYHLPTKLPNLDHQELIRAMKHDKKKDDRGLHFILPKRIGHLVIKHVPDVDIFGR